MSVERIKLAAIRTDGGTQPRARTCEVTVERYANAMTDGARLPPVVVFFDGTAYWLADGFHRCAASRAADFVDIDADVRQGTQDDAIRFSWSANETDDHTRAALPRTNADRRRVVESALRFYANKGERRSDGQIAEECRVGRKLVLDVRSQLVLRDKLEIPTRVIAKDGKIYETANTGKSPPRTKPATDAAAALNDGMAGNAPAPVVALMPDENLFAPEPWDSGIVPTVEPAAWDESDFLCDVRSQLDSWRDEWVQHRSSASTLIKELRLCLNVMEKEDARNSASNC